MASLLEKLKKQTKIKEVAILDESTLFTNKDETLTDVPAINIALSGSLKGGLKSGITLLCGPSKHFKTAYALLMCSAYMKKYKDAICIYYDSEMGAPQDYFKSFNIDTSRVLHIPITNIEELSFDLMQKLDRDNEDGIKRGQKVFILVDSIGNLASKKEVANAVDGNTAKDMTRAQVLKGFFRMVTPLINLADIPMVGINHIYMEMGLFPKAIVSGGSGPMLSSDNVWIIGKSQEKEGTDLVGYKFTINIEKSRFVREKSKIPITVTFDGGVNRYSGILDLALEAGEVKQVSSGWYQLVDLETGELLGAKTRRKDTETNEFLGAVLKKESFNKWIEDNFKLGQSSMIESDDEISSPI